MNEKDIMNKINNKGTISLRFSIDEKIMLTQYQPINGGSSIEITLPIIEELPQAVAMVIDKVNKALAFDDNIHKLIKISMDNKDIILSTNVKKESDRITKSVSLKQHYLHSK